MAQQQRVSQRPCRRTPASDCSLTLAKEIRPADQQRCHILPRVTYIISSEQRSCLVHSAHKRSTNQKLQANRAIALQQTFGRFVA